VQNCPDPSNPVQERDETKMRIRRGAVMRTV
jgi:hypothetical protein